MIKISEEEYENFKSFIYDAAGISMAQSKQILVSSRLHNRITHYNLAGFDEYYSLITDGLHPQELQHAIDLLTTNETYFFREMKHFDLLRDKILPEHGKNRFRLWSAACSTGEEPYSLAMVLADRMGHTPWEIHCTDISTRVLKQAERGVYPLEAKEKIPPDYLVKYCLKGVDDKEGTLLIDKKLRQHIRFKQLNLNSMWPPNDPYHVIFLRNVLIYFDIPTKKKLVRRLSQQLTPGGYLIVGHSESLNTITTELKAVQPSVYRKPL